LIVVVDVRRNRIDEIADAEEVPAPDLLFGQVREPDLDEIEPRGARRHEVQMKPWVALQPPRDRRMFVGTVVVDDGMDVEVGGRMGIELVQESPKFLMTMPRETRAQDGAFEDIERRKQRRGAVSLVVMRHRAGAAAFHRQPRLRALQRLNLAFLVHAEDQRLLRRIDIQPDDVREFLDKAGVGRELEGPEPVRLQSVRPPDPVNRGGTQPVRGRHRAQTPVGRARGRPVQCRVDDLLLLGRRDLTLASPSRRIFHERRRATGRNASAPQTNRVLAGVERRGDVLARHAVSGEQYNAASKHQALWRHARAHPPLKRRALLAGERQRWRSVHARHGSKPQREVQEDSRSVH